MEKLGLKSTSPLEGANTRPTGNAVPEVVSFLLDVRIPDGCPLEPPSVRFATKAWRHDVCPLALTCWC